MLRIPKKRTLANLIVLSIVVILSSATFLGCTTQFQPKGWSGGSVDNGRLFIGTMTGNLAAIDTSTHNYLWEKPLETSNATAIYGRPAIGDGRVYVGAYNGKFYAFDADSGLSTNRVLGVDNPLPIVGGAAVTADMVYIGSSDGKLYALDASTLEERWNFPTGGKVWATPLIDDETVYIGSFDKKLYALNAITGSKKWEFETEGALIATPIIHDGILYFGSIDRHFYAVNAGNGTLKWKAEVEADSWFWVSPVIHEGIVYAPALDSKVYILDAGNGTEAAEAVVTDSPVSSQPLLINDTIILASQEGLIYSIDTGNRRHTVLNDLKQKILAPLAVGDNAVYIHTADRNLQALNVQTGVVMWTLSLNGK